MPKKFEKVYIFQSVTFHKGKEVPNLCFLEPYFFKDKKLVSQILRRKIKDLYADLEKIGAKPKIDSSKLYDDEAIFKGGVAITYTKNGKTFHTRYYPTELKGATKLNLAYTEYVK